MIKTVIENLEDVAHSLERPVEYLLKYFGFEFGAPVDTKSGKFSVGGKRSTEELASSLDSFIDHYVLCSDCGNPETETDIRKGHLILVCRACGTTTKVNHDHKIREYIIKRQPTLEKVKTTHSRLTVQNNHPEESLNKFWKTNPTREETATQVKQLQSQQRWSDEQLLRIVFVSLFELECAIPLDQKIDTLSLFCTSSKHRDTILVCFEKQCARDKSLIKSAPTILGHFLTGNLFSSEDILEWYDIPSSKVDADLAQEIRQSVKVFVDDLRGHDENQELNTDDKEESE